MATVTGAFAINFAVLADVNPFEHPDLVYLPGEDPDWAVEALITSGVLHSPAAGLNSHLRLNPTRWVGGDTLTARIEISTRNGGIDGLALGLMDEDGNGYGLWIHGWGIQRFRFNEWTPHWDSGWEDYPSIANGDVVEVEYTKTTGVLVVRHQNTQLTALNLTNTTHADKNLLPYFGHTPSDTGPGGVISFAADGVHKTIYAATPTNSAGPLFADDQSSPTFNVGFTFTAGRQVVLQFGVYPGAGTITAVKVAGTDAVRLSQSPTDGGTAADTWFADNIEGGTPYIEVTTTSGNKYITCAVTEWRAGTFGDVEDTDQGGDSSTSAVTINLATTVPCVAFGLVAVNQETSNANLSGPAGYNLIANENNANEHSAIRAVWKEVEPGSLALTFAHNLLTMQWSGVALRLNSPKRIQAGFRFYNDDGVEA